jgi:hypothetical protein
MPVPHKPLLQPRASLSVARMHSSLSVCFTCARVFRMTLSRAGSRARSYAQRSARSERSDLAQAEKEMMWDSSLHLVNRREPWNSSARGLQTAWGAHTSYDLLRFDLEPHPSWVAKAPGVYGEHFDRNLLPTPPPRALFRSSWDPRFVMHNHISSDPVLDGNRLGLNNRRGVPVSFASPTRNYAKR